ncbi:MAG TPA: DUF3833 family protein [Casimicrobiaceae bacterium]|nr:DUF3833 family protein [Casimicrobiaceae bacterium]
MRASRSCTVSVAPGTPARGLDTAFTRTDWCRRTSLEGFGIVQNRREAVTPCFHVRLQGRLDVDRLAVDEHFDWSDGEREHKTWRFVREGSRYCGRRDDTVGDAHGEQRGNAFKLRYVLRVRAGDRDWNIAMDDWLFMIDEHTVVNRIRMRKFGIRVGELSAAFRKS